MRKLFLLSLVLILVACSNDDNSSQENRETSPSTTPEPTSVVASFNGPMLNPTVVGDDDCDIFPEEGEEADCGLEENPDVDDALPLPMNEQPVLGMMLNVPEGFEVLVFSDNEAVIETTDLEAHPGDFQILVHWATAEEVEQLLAGYTNLDYSQQHDQANAAGTLTGYTIPNGELGMVAMWVVDEGRYFVMEGSTVAGYWPLYAATFRQMAISIAMPDA